MILNKGRDHFFSFFELYIKVAMYKPLEISSCKKCGKIIAESKGLIRI